MRFLLPCLLCFDKVDVVCLIFPYPSLTEKAMMESNIYITTLLVAVIVSGFCSPEDTYHIKALSNEACGSIQPCITLSELAQQNNTPAKRTTLKFLPGEHMLSSNISVADTNSYSLLGVLQNATTRIKCEENVGFTFSNILYIRIHHLVFTSCGIYRIVGIDDVIYDSPRAITQMFGLFMDSILQIDIINSTFENSTGTALGGNNSRLALDGNNSFIGNFRGCPNIITSNCQGGGLYASNSSLMFRGYSLFTHNTAKEGGGIYMKSSTLDVVGTISFQQNMVFYGYGGGVYAEKSSLHLCGDIKFRENSAVLGGGMHADGSHLNFCEESSTLFEGNSASRGGGLFISHGIIKAHGHILFNNNLAEHNGGGISVRSSTLHFTNNTVLENNSADSGGGIEAERCTLIFSGNNTFKSNSAYRGGGFFAESATNLTLNGVSVIVNNTACYGGGIYLKHSTISSNGIGDISFITNFANYTGGGVWASSSSINFGGTMQVHKNHAQTYGGGMFIEFSTLTLPPGSNLSANDAYIGGGVYSKESNLYLLGSTFHSNFAMMYGGGTYLQNTIVSLTRTNHFVFNSAGSNGGAVCLHASSLNFSNTNTSFKNNFSNKGGGIYIAEKSFLSFFMGTRVLMENNTAAYQGGAIYVEDIKFNIRCVPDQLREKVVDENIDGLYSCFFQHSFYLTNIRITFESNSAQEAGNALYGGSVETCKLTDPLYSLNEVPTAWVFSATFIFAQNSSDLSVVASSPFNVCPCKNNHPDCEISVINRQVYPGEKITLPVVAVGQRNGTAPAIIRSYVQSGEKLGELQESQSVSQHCTNLFYTVPWSAACAVELLLYVEGSCSKNALMEGNHLRVSLELLSCPIGFNLSKERVCECEPRLQVYTNSCNITDRSVLHSGDFWVGCSNESGGLILYPHCPLDYCMSGGVKFTFNETDKQCKHNRSGLLCGRCKQGLSLTFATSQCTECSSDINLLLLLAFALAGLALVFFLLIFRITVAAGTLNGLIVYANILSLNRDILLSTNSSNFLTVFIAWLNLDFGIPLCFYNGMDAYARTWLQFVFPIYIWIIIGSIILLSNFSHRIAKVFGTNPVAVLATLFLLSYVKILRTIITAVSLTFLEYPGQNKVVWLHDANIGYLEGKHIPLFLAAVFMFLTFFLPYTIVLLLGQRFQAKSHMWLFSWANNSRLKAFMDAYHAPYKPRHRYWTGLLLVIRSIMFLTLGFNPNSDPSATLLLVILTALVIHSWAWVVGGVYKNWWLEMLESSFILNLGIMAAVTYKLQLENCEDRLGVSLKLGGRSPTPAYVSLSIAFVTTTVICAYHIYLQIQNMQPWKMCSKLFSKKAKALSNYFRKKLSASPQESVNERSPQDNKPVPSSSYIQLRETLLESNG